MTSAYHSLVMKRPRTALSGALVLAVLAGCAERTATEPEVPELAGVVNGASLTLPAGAELRQRASAPDSLFITGWSQDVAIRLKLGYTGLGTYALGPEQVEVMLLVGGDARTGGYGGSVAVSGELRVLRASGDGAPFQAELRFDAAHRDGERRFGPVLAFREGQLTTRLQVSRP
jgi:hypothetical protein